MKEMDIKSTVYSTKYFKKKNKIQNLVSKIAQNNDKFNNNNKKK